MLIKTEISVRLVLARVAQQLKRKTPSWLLRLTIVGCSGLGAYLLNALHPLFAPVVFSPALHAVLHGGPERNLVLVVWALVIPIALYAVLLKRLAFACALFLHRRDGIQQAP